ncbi:MAG: hypothetical protein V1806_17840 [Pseudomonadota bacterium]
MSTVAILALAACGLLWVLALVEFFRTMSALSRFRARFGKLPGWR